MHAHQIQPLVAIAVVVATAVTDAIYVLFTAAVSSRRRFAAATLSSLWYVVSSFAVISYTQNWVYVGFAALGSWIGAFASMTLLHKAATVLPTSLAPRVAGELGEASQALVDSDRGSRRQP